MAGAVDTLVEGGSWKYICMGEGSGGGGGSKVVGRAGVGLWVRIEYIYLLVSLN